MPNCPICEHENPIDADRCASCGAALTSIAEARDEGTAGQASSGTQHASSQDRPMQELLGDLLARGRKIEAIKVYRERTGKGLKEAKDAVEAFAVSRNIPIKNIGCGASVLLVLALTVTAVCLAMII
jgi:hypothetical protein